MEEPQALRCQRADHGLKITLTHYRLDLGARAVNGLVFPVQQEAFGDVISEALASGVPVITTPGVGAAERREKLGDLYLGKSFSRA